MMPNYYYLPQECPSPAMLVATVDAKSHKQIKLPQNLPDYRQDLHPSLT
jgi:hypothetical protein